MKTVTEYMRCNNGFNDHVLVDESTLTVAVIREHCDGDCDVELSSLDADLILAACG